MAQEKHRPPLSKAASKAKAANKGEAGQPMNKKVGANLQNEAGSKEHLESGLQKRDAGLASRGNRGADGAPPLPKAAHSSKPHSSTPKNAGQPGGPNLKSRAPQPKAVRGQAEGLSERQSTDNKLSDSKNLKPVSLRQRVEQEPYPTRTNSAPQNTPPVGDDDDDAADRRRAAPARRRFAANDDVPSIGGLIFALQQKPSNRPFIIAGIASAVWMALSFGLVWTVLRPALAEVQSVAAFFQSTSAMSTLAAIIIPITLFWFLALLIWRAQELRLMSSAMTEVAVRLAEPDKAAEQSVASLGQSVRRQVTAMNDAISRALGRAGELEAMVHNEVAALERSYSENEHRIRNLIGELAHERTALTNDSERISSALSGLGQRVTKQIEHQGIQTTQLLEKTSGAVTGKLISSSEQVAQSMSEQSNSVVTTMTAMNDRVGREMPALLERMGKEQIKLGKVVEHASQNLTALDSSIGHHAGALNNALTDRTQQLEGIFRKHVQTMSVSMEERSSSLDNALGNKLQTFDNTLISRMDEFEDTLTNTTQKIDSALSNKAQYLDMAISSRVAELDSALIERTKVIDAAFTERLEALDNALHSSSKTLDQAFAHRAEELGRSMDSRSQYIVQTIGAKTKELDNALMSGAKTLQLTTEDVGKQVMSTIHGLAGQAQVLKEVSHGMQSHVSQITNSLRDQSNFVIQAAAQLENSHDRIGTKLGSSQNHLQQLVESISHRTSDLDNVMGSYSKQLETTLSQAEQKANEITKSLHTRSASQSMEALSELTQLRDAATNQTEQAIHDMKDRIAAVSNEMSSQINSLSSEISDTQSHLKAQLQQIPDTTRKSASLMRRTLQDQLKALESLSSISSGSDHVDVSTPGTNSPDLSGFQAAMGHNNPNNNAGTPQGGQSLAPSQQGQQQNGGQPGIQGGVPSPLGAANLGGAGVQPLATGQQPGQQIGQNSVPHPGQLGQTPQAGQKTDPLANPFEAGFPDTNLPNTGLKGHNDGANERDLEIDAITNSLAKRASEQSESNDLTSNAAPLNQGGNVAGQLGGQLAGHGAVKGAQNSSHWSMGDLLARASESDPLGANSGEDIATTLSNNSADQNAIGQEALGPGALGQGGIGQGATPPININAIAQLVDQAAAVELWRTYRSGLRTQVSSSVYNDKGEAFRQISGLYGSDVGFRSNVDRYITDFDRLLNESEAKDPAGNLSTKHLTSDSGRVYLLLMHAAGRIGG
jgi:DNA anti-recombination protein RmuC